MYTKKVTWADRLLLIPIHKMITNFITLSTINGEDDEEAEEGVAGADIVILVSNCG